MGFLKSRSSKNERPQELKSRDIPKKLKSHSLFVVVGGRAIDESFGAHTRDHGYEFDDVAGEIDRWGFVRRSLNRKDKRH